MKIESVQCNSKTEAESQMPWAAIVVEVDGGYMGFESIADYNTWLNQK
jgi:hypothetical protein